MKVRKEHFLLPKAKTINSGKTKWIQANRKPCDYTKSLNCTSITSQPTLEGLPSALITKLKPDVVLSNGDIIVSSSPLIWQQQDGILRQALLNTEKEVKPEDQLEPVTVDLCSNQSVIATHTNLVAFTAVNTPQLTPIATSQVIKMNDYQVILSSDTLPVTWQDSEKKNNTLASIIPTLKSKSESGFVISDQQMSFTSVGSVNVVGQNRYPAILIKDSKNVLSGNLSSNICSAKQTSTFKKQTSRAISKAVKVRKKQTQGKKIMLKPASSLLSQTALDYRNKDRTESPVEGMCETVDLPLIPSDVEKKSSLNVSVGIDYTIKNSAEPVALVTSTSLPISTSNIIITARNNIDSSLASFEKTDYSQNLTTVKNAEPSIVYDTESNILTSTTSCISGEDQQRLTLNNTVSVIGENVLIDSNTSVICSDGQPLLHGDVLVESNCTVEGGGHLSELIRAEDYRDHTEVILPLDIEHPEEHHTQEYTNNLLSQLSSARVLPNMSSSQVSSVLNALDVNGLGGGKTNKDSVKCEPTEFVKIESLPNVLRIKNKPAEPKYRVCELNKQTCFRCISCMFLSLKAENVEKHWIDDHQSARSDVLEKQLNKRPIKCLGCTNILHSKYALQIHLLCDHNVITTEVHDLIAATLAANKSQRDAKRLASKLANAKTKVASQQTEPTKLPLRTPTPTPSPFVQAVTTDEQKHDSVVAEKIPSTPTFCLFSEIQIPNDKEGTLQAPPQPVNDDKKETVTNNTEVRSHRRYRPIRSKLKVDLCSEVKFAYRCRVERCCVRVSSVANLDYHLRCHQPDSELLFCPECDGQFSVVNWSSLTPHLWRHHQIDIDLYSCQHCGYKSYSYSKLMNNHVKIHGDERPFLCDLCGKGFKTTKQLRNHKGIHRARRKPSSDGEKSENITLDNVFSENICSICGRSFADSRILKHHTENVHNKARPYLCTFCSHTASSKSSLRMHIRQHTGEKPFRCEECQYVTADHNSLRRHKMRHSGKRPYQCPHCPYSCIQATTYKCHLKNKHPGLDEGFMFSCPMCPFRTVKKDNYLAHKAEHDLGGDPRNRRKKPPPPTTDTTQVNLTEEPDLAKSVTYLSDQPDVVELLEPVNNLSSIGNETMELIIPEPNTE